MLNINDIKGKKVESLLRNYSGINPYIRYIKKKYETEKSYFLTPNQADYIKKFHNVEPIKLDKVIEITEYFGEKLKSDHDLNHIPTKILVDTVLAEKENSYHILCKLYKNQKNKKLVWLPKTQIFEDILKEEIEVNVDFDKYTELDNRGWRAFKHQEEGITFLLKNKGCILADDMGLGKTYQSIVAALETGAERVLIICPSSLKINWKREVENFTDEVTIVNGSYWQESRFTIINYDILKNFHTTTDEIKKAEKNKTPLDDWQIRREIVDYDPDIIILDEAHFIKNPKSIRGKILKDIGKHFPIERVWLLTGTPIANRPMDYFNLLSLIKSPVTNNWAHYAKRYCEGRRFKKGKRFIWVTDGASNLDELAKKTKSHLLRRKKENVLDLPEKLVTPVWLELQNKDGYDRVWDDYLEKRRREGKKGNPFKELVEMTLLRTFIAMETVPHSIDKAEEAIENGKKVIIFCNFSDEIDAFLKYFGHKAVCVRGGMNDKQKQASVDRFQEDPNCMVFVGQIRAAGVGLTLTAAEVVIKNSLDWVPGNHEQAEDRAYRIGQNNTVNIYYMLIAETIDELIWDILNKKKKIIGTIMGEEELIEEFIKQTENE
jgi:SWI/SNF-related matrix-associated actin-dependent regulator 1 of chromatin subfamily A